MTLSSQEGVRGGGEEVKIFATICCLAHPGAELGRWNVPEYFENADEVIDTNNILFHAVVRPCDPGDCIAGRDTDNDEQEENISEDAHV